MNTSLQKSIADRLLSPNIEDQLQAFDDARNTLQLIAEAGVEALERAKDRLLIAERLHWLGTACLPPLDKMLRGNIDRELQVLGSLVALQLGSSVGVKTLIEVIESNEMYSVLAARHLAAHSHQSAKDSLLKGLAKLDVSRIDEIVSYVEALRQLGHEVPPELAVRLKAESTPWQVRSLFE